MLQPISKVTNVQGKKEGYDTNNQLDTYMIFVYGDMVCLALALAPSCATLHFWCLYIMLSKSYLPRIGDGKAGVFYKSSYKEMEAYITEFLKIGFLEIDPTLWRNMW